MPGAPDSVLLPIGVCEEGRNLLLHALTRRFKGRPVRYGSLSGHDGNDVAVPDR